MDASTESGPGDDEPLQLSEEPDDQASGAEVEQAAAEEGPPAAEPADGALAFDRSTGRLVWGVTLATLVAALFIRALAPALPGVWVGIDHVITVAKLVAAISSQLAAVCISALVMALVVATVRRPFSLALRAFSVGVGALVVLAVMIASATRLPQLSSMIVGLGAALLSAAVAIHSSRLLGLRAASLVVVAMAVSGLLRLAAIGSSLVVLAREGAPGWEMAARALATLSWLTLLVAVVLGLAWLLTQPERVGATRLLGRAATVGIAAFGALALMLFAQSGSGEASGMALLVARASARLTPHPLPYVPWLLRLTTEWLAVTTALAVVGRAPRTLLMSAAIAAALLSDAALEMPLGAASLVVAALALMHHPAVDMRRELSS